MHEKRIEIRWNDIDGLGHVNSGVYATYFEEIRDACLQALFGHLTGRDDYVMARVAIDYRAELRLSDGEAIGRCRVAHVGRTSIRTEEELRSPSGVLAAEAEAVVVRWDRETGAPKPLTDEEREALLACPGAEASPPVAT